MVKYFSTLITFYFIYFDHQCKKNSDKKGNDNDRLTDHLGGGHIL